MTALLLTNRVCPVCDATGVKVRGPGLQGENHLCINCFMIWYDSGIQNREVLRTESIWRRENDFWPWGDGHPTLKQLEELRHGCP